MTGKPLTVFSPLGEQPDAKALAQIEMVMQDDRAVAGALMADHHLGYSMPIGGVVAYDNAISPSGVGFDIACGNKAVRTPIRAGELIGGRALPALMDEIQRKISFGLGRVNDTPIDHELFDEHADTLRELDGLAGKRAQLSQRARAQLGTVGSGNHYIDVLADEDGWIWIACHFGSRGLGHTIASGFLNLAHNLPFEHRGKEREEATVFGADTDLGAFYIAAMQLAGDYAYAGRDYAIDTVVRGILDTVAVESVHVHHNFAWLEQGLWVVRKGATPIFADQLAFIGGSMGEGAAIVRRKPDGEPGAFAPDLGSAPHGAGRIMSRTAAAGKIKRRSMYGCPVRECDETMTPQEHDAAIRQVADPAQGVPCPAHPEKRMTKFTKTDRVTPGAIDWPAVQQGLYERGIIVRGGAADEAPGVYKSLYAVLAAHPTIEIVHWLEPVGVVMAGDDVFDPYKD